MCLEWMFCNFLLVRFKLMWNMSWVKLGEGVDSRYTWEYLEYVQNKAYTDTRKEYVGWNGVSGAVFVTHPLGCDRDRRPEVTFQKVPPSFGYFATVKVWSRCWIFTWWFVSWGEWVLIILVTQVLLIHIDWSDDRSQVQSIHTGVL